MIDSGQQDRRLSIPAHLFEFALQYACLQVCDVQTCRRVRDRRVPLLDKQTVA
jgi:hypothetical protein